MTDSTTSAAISAAVQSQQQANNKPLYPRAPVSLILRTWDRNGTEVDNLENRISTVARDWFGGAFPAMHDRKIQFAADFIYFAATMLLGKTTLGEEQSGLTLVQTNVVKSFPPGGNSTNIPPVSRVFLAPPSRVRLIVQFVAHLAVPHILRRIWEYFFPEQDSSDGVRRTLMTHIAWWWLWSSRNTLTSWVPETVATRISGLTSVSTDLKLYSAAQQSSEQYPFLGGLTLVRVAVELFLWGREKYRNRNVNRSSSTSSESSSLPTSSSSRNFAEDRARERASHNSSPTTNTGTCPLCLAPRVNPTATSCGHVFCWNCLSELLESGSGGVEPRCPLCREVVRPQGFVLLPNFAIPRSMSPSNS